MAYSSLGRQLSRLYSLELKLIQLTKTKIKSLIKLVGDLIKQMIFIALKPNAHTNNQKINCTVLQCIIVQ